MADFAATYRELILPKLMGQIASWGVIVAGGGSYARAHVEITQFAHKYGSGFLPKRIRDDLDDWIDASLLKAIVKNEPYFDDPARERVYQDVMTWNQSIISHFSLNAP